MADVVADKQEITEVMTRYCYAVDFRDLEQLRTVFTPDVQATYVLEAVGMDDVHVAGVDALIEWLGATLPALGDPAPRHAMTNFLIEVDGDTARSRNYMGAGAGLYTVDHVRTPDGWRAARFEMRNFGTSVAR